MTPDKREENLIFEIPADFDSVRLDKALSSVASDLSRSFIQKLIEQEKVTVNHEIVREKKQPVEAGDVVTVSIPEPSLPEIQPQDMNLDIVYEDDDVVVINKPAGLVVHPAPGNPDGTLVNGLMARYRGRLSSINGVLRPGIVHRIDKDTSGLLMVARNDRAHESLSEQLARHSIIRKYRMIVLDNIKEDEGTIDRPIGRDPSNRLRNCVVQTGGKNAVTHYRVMERFGKYTLVEAALETGRTHQIRVHMSYIKHPLLGDSLYGPEKNRLGAHRQMLHAGSLGFIHPVSGQEMIFDIEPPEDFQNILSGLRSGN